MTYSEDCLRYCDIILHSGFSSVHKIHIRYVLYVITTKLVITALTPSYPHILAPPSHKSSLHCHSFTSSLHPHTLSHPHSILIFTPPSHPPSLQVQFFLLGEQVQLDVILPLQTTTDLLEQRLVHFVTSPSPARNTQEPSCQLRSYYHRTVLNT